MGFNVPEEVWVVAIEAHQMLDFSERLTAPVEATVPRAADAVLELLLKGAGRLTIMISPELLRRYELFGSLSDEQLQSLASIIEEASWEAGEAIFEIDSPADTLYLLMEGSIDLFYRSEDELKPDLRKEFSVGEINPGEPFAISALFEPYILTASAVASRPSSGIRMDAQRLIQLCSYDLEMGMILQRELIKAIFERLTYARTQLAAARA